MKSCPTKWLLIFAISTGVAWSGWGQGNVSFSKPKAAKSAKANSEQGNSDGSVNAGDYQAPHRFFNDFSPNLPAPPVYVIPPAAVKAWQKQQNWTLLTPDQILGVKSPAEILNQNLGIKDQNQDNNLSLEQQFLLRNNNRSDSFGGATNASGSFTVSQRQSRNSFFNLNTDNSSSGNPGSDTSLNQGNGNNWPLATANSSRAADANQSAPRQSSFLSHFFNTASASDQSGQPNQNSLWISGFSRPQSPKASPAEIAARERFRALLMPPSAPSQNASPGHNSLAPAFNSFTPVKPARDPFLQRQPQYNPAGQSVSVLEDNSARPVGLQPLPGITGPSPQPETKRPAWQAQLPPWMRKGPKSHW